MILAELFMMIEIEAPAERVWQVLTDFGRYPDWNPFLRSVEGSVRNRAQLKVALQPAGRQLLHYRPRVVTLRPPRELRWAARLPVPGLLGGEDRFVVERLDDHRSRLIHERRLRGLLVPFVRRRLEGPVKRGFEAMSLALKHTAERES